MSPVLRRTFAAALALFVLSGCLGFGSGDDGPLDAGSMDAALNALGGDVTDGDGRPISDEDCPLIDGDDLVDALVDADVIDRGEVDDVDAEVTSLVAGVWGAYTVTCLHPTFNIRVRNGGANDRDELIDITESDPDADDREIEPADIDGLDASRTYEISRDGEAFAVGWIDDETNVEVSIGGDTDDDRLAAELVTVLELLDEEYGDTEAVERPDAPPIDLADVRDTLRELRDDVDDLSQGELLDECPAASQDEIEQLVDEIGLDSDEIVVGNAFIIGTNGLPNVSIQCSFRTGDASVSIGAALVEFDGLDELQTVLTSAVVDVIDREFDVDAQADRLPDDAVFSVRDGEDVVGAGVLSDEVQIQVTVARGELDEDDLLAVLPNLVDLVTGTLG